MTYQTKLVKLTGQLISQNGLVGFPASYRYGLISTWVCLPTNTDGGDIDFIGGGFWPSFSNSAIGMRIGWSGAYFVGGFGPISIGGIGPSNVIISFDSVGQIAQCAVNDALLTVNSGGWIGSGNVTTSGGDALAIAAGGGSTMGMADTYATSPSAFYDLSIVANRRKFINADLTPVDLGTTGQTPTGLTPPVFLHVDAASVTPNDYATNLGSAGPFTITSGPLEFFTSGPCPAGPFPPLPPPPVPGIPIHVPLSPLPPSPIPPVVIPLHPIPSQTITTNLDNQSCRINVRQTSTGVFLDLYVNDALIIGGVLCQNLNPIVRSVYLGFKGDLAFYDTQPSTLLGPSDPVYTGLGSRYVLEYYQDAT